MKEETKRILYVLVGAVAVWFVAMLFFRVTGLVGTATNPTTAEGAPVGTPIATGLILVIEFIISSLMALGALIVGGAMTLWNRWQGTPSTQSTPVVQTRANTIKVPRTANEMVEAMERPQKVMSPQETQGWWRTVQASIQEGNYKALIKAGEKLHGGQFFPRNEKKDDADE